MFWDFSEAIVAIPLIGEYFNCGGAGNKQTSGGLKGITEAVSNKLHLKSVADKKKVLLYTSKVDN